VALAWAQGLFGDPARLPGGEAARQRELAVLPGKPGAEPHAQPSLDPLSALNQNAAVPFVKGPITPARAFKFTGSAVDRLQATECLALTAMAEALLAVGGDAYEREDGLVVQGTGGEPLPGGGPIATHLDHRIAMSMAVAGMASKAGVEVDDTRPIATSFPMFETLLDGLAT